MTSMSTMAMTAMTMGFPSTALGTMPTAPSTASSTGKASMGGMGMDPSPNACKISMLWNWYTINSCFIAHSWRITSKSMFAGSCIGVVLLVMILEALRRLGREYDAFILRRAHIRCLYLSDASSSTAARAQHFKYAKCQRLTDSTNGGKPKHPDCQSEPSPYDDVIKPVTDLPSGKRTVKDENSPGSSHSNSKTNSDYHQCDLRSFGPYRPSVVEQTVRAMFHMVQFAVAYFIMLLAMYYNGYIIICIFVGAFLGSFVFSWEVISLNKENDATTVTKCCG